MSLHLLFLSCNIIKRHFFTTSLCYLSISYDSLSSLWHSVCVSSLSISSFLTFCPISSFTSSLNSSIFFSLEIQPQTQKSKNSRGENPMPVLGQLPEVSLTYFTSHCVSFLPKYLIWCCLLFFRHSLSTHYSDS